MSATNTPIFRIAAGTLRGNQFELTWQSVPSQFYAVETSPVPGGGIWALAADEIPGTPRTNSTSIAIPIATLPGAPNKELYFRIKAR